MKQFEYSKKAWHWRLANTYGNIRTSYHRGYTGVDGTYVPSEEYYDGDLCTYIQHIFGGLFKLLCFSAVGFIICIPLAFSLVYLAACISTGMWIPLGGEGDEPVIVGLALWMIMTGTGLWGVSYYHYEKYREKHPKPEKIEKEVVSKEPSFVKLAYLKFKDKTCARILVK